MDLLHDTGFWLLIAFGTFSYILWKKGTPAFVSLLDARIDEIKKELKTAENLRVEAQELLAQYQRKQRDAIKEAESIIKGAQKQADVMRAEAEQNLAAIIDRREKQLKERLQFMEQAAIEEIQIYAADLSIKATAEIISENLDKKTNQTLVDKAIKDVSEKVH